MNDDNGNYKERWLDILNIGSIKRPPRAPKELVDTIAKVSPNPSFVRQAMQDWREGKVTTEEMHECLKDKFGETTFKKIENTAINWQNKHQD